MSRYLLIIALSGVLGAQHKSVLLRKCDWLERLMPALSIHLGSVRNVVIFSFPPRRLEYNEVISRISKLYPTMIMDRQKMQAGLVSTWFHRDVALLLVLITPNTPLANFRSVLNLQYSTQVPKPKLGVLYFHANLTLVSLKSKYNSFPELIVNATIRRFLDTTALMINTLACSPIFTHYYNPFSKKSVYDFDPPDAFPDKLTKPHQFVVRVVHSTSFIFKYKFNEAESCDPFIRTISTIQSRLGLRVKQWMYVARKNMTESEVAKMYMSWGKIQLDLKQRHLFHIATNESSWLFSYGCERMLAIVPVFPRPWIDNPLIPVLASIITTVLLQACAAKLLESNNLNNWAPLNLVIRSTRSPHAAMQLALVSSFWIVTLRYSGELQSVLILNKSLSALPESSISYPRSKAELLASGLAFYAAPPIANHLRHQAEWSKIAEFQGINECMRHLLKFRDRVCLGPELIVLRAPLEAIPLKHLNIYYNDSLMRVVRPDDMPCLRYVYAMERHSRDTVRLQHAIHRHADVGLDDYNWRLERRKRVPLDYRLSFEETDPVIDLIPYIFMIGFSAAAVCFVLEFLSGYAWWRFRKAGLEPRRKLVQVAQKYR